MKIEDAVDFRELPFVGKAVFVTLAVFTLVAAFTIPVGLAWLWWRFVLLFPWSP